MKRNAPVLYKRFLIALAVLSSSACSNFPQGSSYDFAGVGNSVERAGKVTECVPQGNPNTTGKLPGYADTKDSPSVHVLPKELVPKIKIRALQRSSLARTATAAAITKGSMQPTKDLIPRASLAQGTEDPLHENGDLLHEVAIGENLWVIAKQTTGSALNWHILADVNSLPRNATIFPGQQLVIPASLISEGKISAFKLHDGETLWKFSNRTTGDAKNWQAIAKHNNFTVKQSVTVHPGQTIQVPKSLIGEDVAALSM